MDPNHQTVQFSLGNSNSLGFEGIFIVKFQSHPKLRVTENSFNVA